jgi:hypothetical protein
MKHPMPLVQLRREAAALMLKIDRCHRDGWRATKRVLLPRPVVLISGLVPVVLQPRM